MELRILLTMHLEEYFQQSWQITIFGPNWLHWPSLEWPKQHQIPHVSFRNDCVEEVCHHLSIQTELPIIPLDRYSDYHHLKRITAWVI